LLHGRGPKPADVSVVSSKGAKLPFSVQLTTGASYDVLRIAVTAGEGTKVMVKPFHAAALAVTKQAGASELTVTPGTEKNYSWTCSYEATRVLLPSIDAPAFRVTIASDAAGLDSAGATTALIPGRAGFSMEPNPPLALRLGHLNCLGNSITWNGVSVARVTALLADGTEVVAKELVKLEPVFPPDAGE
jgi:hypothetical protein